MVNYWKSSDAPEEEGCGDTEQRHLSELKVAMHNTAAVDVDVDIDDVVVADVVGAVAVAVAVAVGGDELDIDVDVDNYSFSRIEKIFECCYLSQKSVQSYWYVFLEQCPCCFLHVLY